MKNEFTCVELSDEQLELVVGGCHHHHHRHRSRQTGVAANVGGNFAFNLQNANATNQVGFININVTVQNNILIII
jgi:hypothetical protein